MNGALGGCVPSKTNASRDSFARRSRHGRKTAAPNEVAGPSRPKRSCPNRPSSGCGRRSGCNRTSSSSSRPIPFFIEDVRDIVGVHSRPPVHALVLCVDEKSQTQTLERVQPLLPMGLGYVKGVTHNYIRHGTTTLFAALNIASGTVLTQCKPKQRYREFLQFLKHLDPSVSRHLDIHLIVDNYSTHKNAKITRWLAARQRHRIRFKPTCASWLNQVEIWFNIVTPKSHLARLLPFGQGTRGRDYQIRRGVQPVRPSLRVDCDGRFDLPEDSKIM